MKPTLLIVDDDEEIRSQMKWALVEDYDILTAQDRDNALLRFREHRPPVVLLDLGLPPHPGTPDEGLETLGEILAANRDAKVIIISGQSEKEIALQAVGQGAYDFLAKPVDMDELKVILKRAYHVAHLEQEHRRLRDAMPVGGFEGMLGTSPAMQSVFSQIEKVATAEAPVLILGESGTGKEMAAQAIHRRSHRKEGPFVAINCGAIPENLLESELFGHEKGSFTGAHAQRKGRIEMASEGTLFLDEIGELPLPLQVKLLRFLQEQQIDRVGGRKPVPVDARVIAATNADLTRAMNDGTFREDLFYRLAVVTLKLPPLRDHPTDLPMLGKAFLQRFSRDLGKNVANFSPDAQKALQAYTWPGNVRELENRVKRAVIMADGPSVTAHDLELTGKLNMAQKRSLKAAREAVEREMVQEALRRHNGKITAAASDLGISRPTLYELMDKLKIER